MMEDKIR